MANKLDPKEVDKYYQRIKLKPLEPYINNHTPRKSECLVCGSIVYPRFSDVKKAKSCVKCQGKNTGRSIRLGDKEINLTAKKMKIKLLQPYTNSRTPIKAKCLVCQNTIYPTLSRLRAGVGCLYCGRVKSSTARLIPKDIALRDFKIAKLRVLSEYKNSHQILKVQCLVCKKFSTKSYKDLKSGRRCYTCGRADSARKRRLSLQYINEISKRQQMILLGEPKPGKQNSKFKCLQCQRVIEMTIFSIQRGASCRFCSRTEVDPKEAQKYMIKNHLKPLESYLKSAAPWKCRCLKCKNIVYPTYNRVKTFGGGCIYCRSAGYNPSYEGYIYLLFSPKFDSYKLGISNIKGRIRAHELKGWTVVRKWDFNDGHIPPILEEEILRHIRIKWKLPWSVDTKSMPQGGHTETFSSVNLPEIKVLRLVETKIRSVKVDHA
jgi:hypothetical protein